MIRRFTNVKTGQVQAVLDGSRLHRLVEANPAGYVPVADKPAPAKKEAARGTGNPGRRGSKARKELDGK